VISNKLFFFFLWHRTEWVESSSQITLESLTCFNNFVHNLNSLFICNTWCKWISLEIATDTNTSWNNHGLLVLWKRWALQLWRVHIGSVLGVRAVLVVGFNYLVKEFIENLVWAVRTSVATNTWVDVLGSWNDASFEWNSKVVFFILVLFPNFSSSKFACKWLLVICGPNWEISKILRTLQPGTAGSLASNWSWSSNLRSMSVFRWCATHLIVIKV